MKCVWNELAIATCYAVRYSHAGKNTGHEGPAAGRSGCRMVCLSQTAGETDPRTFRVQFVVASCSRPTPGALSVGLVHVAVGTELNDTSVL